MNIVLTAQPVNVVLTGPDDAVSFTWRVIDQSETALSAMSAAVVLTAGPEASITVSQAINTLAAGEIRALRSVEAYFTSAAGITKMTAEYLVEVEQTLVVNKNTFQTYGEAVLGAYDLFGLIGWNIATKQDRAAALISARRHISQLRFQYEFDAYQDVIDSSVGVSDLTLVSQSNWEALPVDFKAALKRAQIYEADFLLTGGDSLVDAKRRSGIISETIGESSMFLRSQKALEQAVCKRSMKELSKYVVHRVRSGRT